MLLIEHFQAYGREPNLRVFATDTEINSIEVARAGVYAESDMVGVSAQRVQRFFHRYGSSRLQVSAALRDCVVFATHDLEIDPPLSRLDFVDCRKLPKKSHTGVEFSGQWLADCDLWRRQ